MLEREMVDQFRIYPDDVMYIAEDQLVLADGETYLLRPIEEKYNTLLAEKISMAQWLTYNGEQDIAIYMKPGNKKNTLYIDGQDMVVFQIPKRTSEMESYKKISFGKRLAQFHKRGYFYKLNNKKSDAFNYSWKDRWVRRLDQLERWYMNLLNEHGKTYFDEQFCLTFPYFMGVSENAIQMMADLDLEHSNQQQRIPKTICHERFQEHTWLTIEEQLESRVKIPIDFTYDHFTRDLAEFIRTIWLEHDGDNRGEEIIHSFLNHYESEYALSVTDQRYIVARLLFPAHYYERVERIYQTINQEKKRMLEEECIQLFQHSADYERLISFILKRYPLLVNGNLLPDWVKNSS